MAARMEHFQRHQNQVIVLLVGIRQKLVVQRSNLQRQLQLWKIIHCMLIGLVLHILYHLIQMAAVSAQPLKW